jgi:sarcosine oxidase subunit beta
VGGDTEPSVRLVRADFQEWSSDGGTIGLSLPNGAKVFDGRTREGSACRSRLSSIEPNPTEQRGVRNTFRGGSSVTATYETIIVGGGNLGLWTAYHLARRGVRVAVCERHWAGGGATSRSAGMIRQQGGTETAIRLGMRSRALYLQLGAELKLDSGFRQTGYYVLAEREEDQAAFAELVELRRRCGLENEWVDRAEGARRFPALNWDLLAGATFTASDGYVEPAVVVRNITLALLRSGTVDLFEDCPVGSLEKVGDAFRLGTPRGVLETGKVVNAAGPRGFLNVGALLAREELLVPGSRRPVVTASRHQIVSFPKVAAMAVQPWPMALALERGLYLRPDEHGILLGMTNPNEKTDPSDRHQLEFDWGYYEQLRPEWEALVPALAGLEVSRAWAAAVDRTPDHKPIIDEPRPGFFVLAAGSHGMMQGPALGEKLAEVIDGQPLTGIPPEEVRLSRFWKELQKDSISLPTPDEG